MITSTYASSEQLRRPRATPNWSKAQRSHAQCSLIIYDCRCCSLLLTCVDSTMVDFQQPSSSRAALLQHIDGQANWDEVRR